MEEGSEINIQYISPDQVDSKTETQNRIIDNVEENKYLKDISPSLDDSIILQSLDGEDDENYLSTLNNSQKRSYTNKPNQMTNSISNCVEEPETENLLMKIRDY